MVSFARMFRLARVVRLMIRFKQIRIILDTMVRTLPLGHQEDDRWTEGPSLDQLSVLREVFQRYDGGTGHVPITSLHCMLCDLGAPLGLKKVQRKRTLMPERVHLTEMDRILEHMIRAELNLCIRSTREVEASNAKNLRYQLGLKPLQKRKLFLHGVSYEDGDGRVLLAWCWLNHLELVVKECDGVIGHINVGSCSGHGFL